jgi:RNA polymerase sigma-70 factor, ECF subfamily
MTLASPLVTACTNNDGIMSVIILKRVSMESHKGEVTLLLGRLAEGDSSAEEALLQLVYVELHRLAVTKLKSERPNHTLQATALVHEAYMRLCGPNEIKYQDRAHFFRISARVMRHILVDYARQHGAKRRGSGQLLQPLDDAIAVSACQVTQVLEINELLDRLARLAPRQAQVVEMRFYAGLTEEEIALALGKNVRTIKRDWLMARAWLHEQLQEE